MGDRERREKRQPRASLPLHHRGDAGIWRVSRPLLPAQLFLLSCFREAQASSWTEPAPKRDSSVSLAASQVASSSRPARMLEPVAPISSWHQVILALSVLTSPSWNLCSNSANQSDSTCCLWLYFPMWLTMEFIVGILLYDSDSKFFLFFTFCFLELLFTFYFTFLFRTAFYFLLFLYFSFQNCFLLFTF